MVIPSVHDCRRRHAPEWRHAAACQPAKGVPTSRAAAGRRGRPSTAFTALQSNRQCRHRPRPPTLPDRRTSLRQGPTASAACLLSLPAPWDTRQSGCGAAHLHITPVVGHHDCKTFVAGGFLHACSCPILCLQGPFSAWRLCLNACMTSLRQCSQPQAPAAALPSSMEQQRPVISPAHGAGTPMAAPGQQQQVAMPARPLLRVCANCRTADTPRWMKGPTAGSVMCNACGLYLKQTGFHRPPRLFNHGRVRLAWSIRPCMSCMCTRGTDDG